MDEGERKAKEHIEKIGAAFQYECLEEKKPEGNAMTTLLLNKDQVLTRGNT